MDARGAPGQVLSESRLQALLKLVPAIQVFTLVDAVLLSWYFWDNADLVFLTSWTLAIALHGGFWWWFALALRSPDPGRPGRWRWSLVHAATEAFLFSTFSIVVFPHVEPDKAVVLGAFATGLLAAGALSKMSVPQAAYVFIVVLTLGAGSAFGLAAIPALWVAEFLLGAFAVALGVLVTSMSKIFDARVEAELEVGRQKALVSDLLDDFGESASEAFWETDAGGRLTLVTPRLASLAGSTPQNLIGTLLAGSDWAPLADRGTAFRNVEVPIDTPEGRRWWSLTGKPLHGSLATGWRGVAMDVTDHRQRELEVIRLSRFDSLTGLLNRSSFRTFLDDLFDSGTHPGRRCLVLIDIVDFKDVNESRGHAFGDALLMAVADRLKQRLPERLVLARLDGDEFALEGAVSVSRTDSIERAHRLLSGLTEPYQIGDDRFEAGFRVGLSFTPDDASTPDQWLRCSDLALRVAKANGRNLVQSYAPAMMSSFLERNLLKNALRQALASGELHLEYQPIVRLADGRVTGFEALARWTHPAKGKISPAVFIPLAEESEVILDLGLWVLAEACRTAKNWPEDITVSVNVSGVQLRAGSLAEAVAEVLGREGFPANRLILEVTESALVKEDGHLMATFETLKRRGIRWALDDFGTGYSSLSYLQDYPFDKLKIDQSFIRPRAGRNPSPALLGSIVALARALGLTTTAEGIEDEAHRELLRSLGCDKGQGYLFSRPVTAVEAHALVGRRL